MIRKMDQDTFASVIQYSQFKERMNKLDIRPILKKESKIANIDIESGVKYLEQIKTLLKNKSMTPFEVARFPMSLSILGKCLAEDENQTPYEFAARMSQYNAKPSKENYVYLKTLCAICREGLYLNTSNTDYPHIKNISIYTMSNK